MKIGDKVRFLSESGGGRIAGFKGNNLVLVEDQDGFEIPMPINEVVVVGDEDYSTKRMVEVEQRNRAQEKAKEDKRSLRQRLNEGTDDAEARAKGQDAETVTAKDLAADDPSINFEPQPQERRGGDKPTVCLAFVPMDKQNFSTTRFESYLVNDSNYYVHFTYLVAEGSTWSLRQTGEVEPNTKLFLEEIGREFRRRFAGCQVDRILTIEASGIGIACLAAPAFDHVPVVFAKKNKTKNIDGNVYLSQVESFTQGKRPYPIFVSKEFLHPGERVLLIDDFLANGNAALGAIELIDQAGAQLAGMGFIIEKAFQQGGGILRDRGIHIESLAMIDSLDNCRIHIRD